MIKYVCVYIKTTFNITLGNIILDIKLDLCPSSI